MDDLDQEFHHQVLGFGISVVVALFFVPFLYFSNSLYEKQSLQKQPQREEVSSQTLVVAETQKYPVRLMIPVIGVNARIQHVGVTPEGEMGVPSNTIDVGWFKFGFRPGEKGNAVIAGHFNGKNDEAGVFVNLNKLKNGDKIYVEDNKRILTVFVVREVRFYDTAYADEIFGRSDSAHLNLITCFGAWNDARKSYNERLIVIADAIL